MNEAPERDASSTDARARIRLTLLSEPVRMED